MADKITHRDYLLKKAAAVASSMTDAIDYALSTDDELYAIEHLERKLATLRTDSGLTAARPNPERVLPRPEPRT